MSDSITFEFIGGPNDGFKIELGNTAYQFSFPVKDIGEYSCKQLANYVYLREPNTDKFTFAGVTSVK